MSIYNGGDMITVSVALSTINFRLGWRISKSYFYHLLVSGEVPARVIERNVNCRYLLSRRELEQWIAAYEARHREGATA